MRAVVIDEPGGPEVLRLRDVPDLVPAAGEVVLTSMAAGVNRADLAQRQGFYPPPPGASPYPGLECSGRIAAVAGDVTGWQPGDAACALLAGRSTQVPDTATRQAAAGRSPAAGRDLPG
jgi:NADPH:quinone reductase-like Zn-dependent oxidoreductase